MNRRQFLAASATAAAASVLDIPQHADAQTTGPKNHDLASPPDKVEYFTAEEMRKCIEPVPTAGIDYQAVCYTFNPWHTTPWMEARFGKGWTEWETMRMARPQFPGHYQPKRPLWGCFNEADPTWSEHEIDLAASAGITAFMIDWYWHEGTMFYHEQLEQGLLKARNRDKIKFAVMWANHDWPNCYPAPEEGKEAIILPQTYSDADFPKMTDYLIEHYFHQPNYWKIDGKPVFAIFHTSGIIGKIGAAKLHKIFDDMRDRCVKAGLPGLHIQGSHGFDPGKTPLREAGFESATCYHTFAGVGKTKTPTFAECARFGIERWKREGDKLDIPYFPECPVGWDNSPRYGKNAKIVINRTADQYERLLEAAKYFVASRKTNPPVVFMGAWNEWTEDHYLLPDEVHGYSYLEAVKRQFVG